MTKKTFYQKIEMEGPARARDAIGPPRGSRVEARLRGGHLSTGSPSRRAVRWEGRAARAVLAEPSENPARGEAGFSNQSVAVVVGGRGKATDLPTSLPRACFGPTSSQQNLVSQFAVESRPAFRSLWPQCVRRLSRRRRVVLRRLVKPVQRFSRWGCLRRAAPSFSAPAATAWALAWVISESVRNYNEINRADGHPFRQISQIDRCVMAITQALAAMCHRVRHEMGSSYRTSGRAESLRTGELRCAQLVCLQLPPH